MNLHKLRVVDFSTPISETEGKNAKSTLFKKQHGKKKDSVISSKNQKPIDGLKTCSKNKVPDEQGGGDQNATNDKIHRKASTKRPISIKFRSESEIFRTPSQTNLKKNTRNNTLSFEDLHKCGKNSEGSNHKSIFNIFNRESLLNLYAKGGKVKRNKKLCKKKEDTNLLFHHEAGNFTSSSTSAPNNEGTENNNYHKYKFPDDIFGFQKNNRSIKPCLYQMSCNYCNVDDYCAIGKFNKRSNRKAKKQKQQPAQRRRSTEDFSRLHRIRILTSESGTKRNNTLFNDPINSYKAHPFSKDTGEEIFRKEDLCCKMTKDKDVSVSLNSAIPVTVSYNIGSGPSKRELDVQVDCGPPPGNCNCDGDKPQEKIQTKLKPIPKPKEQKQESPTTRTPDKITLKLIESIINCNAGKRTSPKNCIKFVLIGLLVIAWSPCLLAVFLAWIVMLPVRMSKRSDKNAIKKSSFMNSIKDKIKFRCCFCKCKSVDQQRSKGLLTSFSSWLMRVATTTSNSFRAVLSILKLNRSSTSGPTLMPLKHPNPKHRYDLYYTDNRGWVMKRTRPKEPQNMVCKCLQRLTQKTPKNGILKASAPKKSIKEAECRCFDAWPSPVNQQSPPNPATAPAVTPQVNITKKQFHPCNGITPIRTGMHSQIPTNTLISKNTLPYHIVNPFCGLAIGCPQWAVYHTHEQVLHTNKINHTHHKILCDKDPGDQSKFYCEKPFNSKFLYKVAGCFDQSKENADIRSCKNKDSNRASLLGKSKDWEDKERKILCLIKALNRVLENENGPNPKKDSKFKSFIKSFQTKSSRSQSQQEVQTDLVKKQSKSTFVTNYKESRQGKVTFGESPKFLREKESRTDLRKVDPDRIIIEKHNTKQNKAKDYIKKFDKPSPCPCEMIRSDPSCSNLNKKAIVTSLRKNIEAACQTNDTATPSTSGKECVLKSKKRTTRQKDKSRSSRHVKPVTTGPSERRHKGKTKIRNDCPCCQIRESITSQSGNANTAKAYKTASRKQIETDCQLQDTNTSSPKRKYTSESKKIQKCSCQIKTSSTSQSFDHAANTITSSRTKNKKKNTSIRKKIECACDIIKSSTPRFSEKACAYKRYKPKKKVECACYPKEYTSSSPSSKQTSKTNSSSSSKSSQYLRFSKGLKLFKRPNRLSIPLCHKHNTSTQYLSLTSSSTPKYAKQNPHYLMSCDPMLSIDKRKCPQYQTRRSLTDPELKQASRKSPVYVSHHYKYPYSDRNLNVTPRNTTLRDSSKVKQMSNNMLLSNIQFEPPTSCSRVDKLLAMSQNPILYPKNSISKRLFWLPEFFPSDPTCNSSFTRYKEQLARQQMLHANKLKKNKKLTGCRPCILSRDKTLYPDKKQSKRHKSKNRTNDYYNPDPECIRAKRQVRSHQTPRPRGGNPKSRCTKERRSHQSPRSRGGNQKCRCTKEQKSHRKPRGSCSKTRSTKKRRSHQDCSCTLPSKCECYKPELPSKTFKKSSLKKCVCEKPSTCQPRHKRRKSKKNSQASAGKVKKSRESNIKLKIKRETQKKKKEATGILRSCWVHLIKELRRSEREAWPSGFTCRPMYLNTLRHKPCFWIYKLCPSMYPCFLNIHRSYLAFSRICVYIAAFCFWLPFFCAAYFCCEVLFCGCCNDHCP